MLDEFLFMKVDEVSKGRNRIKPNNPKIQHSEVMN